MGSRSDHLEPWHRKPALLRTPRWDVASGSAEDHWSWWVCAAEPQLGSTLPTQESGRSVAENLGLPATVGQVSIPAKAG